MIPPEGLRYQPGAGLLSSKGAGNIGGGAYRSRVEPPDSGASHAWGRAG